MAKGSRHSASGNRKTTHYPFKKRCGCKKRAKKELDGKYYCNRCWRKLLKETWQ